jgi:hypothetical protein
MLTSKYRKPIMHSAVAAKSKIDGTAKKKYIHTGVVWIFVVVAAGWAAPFEGGFWFGFKSASRSVAAAPPPLNRGSSCCCCCICCLCCRMSSCS